MQPLKSDLEIHASVMMNVHNLEMIKALEKHGVKRVVLSREATLAEAHYFHTHSNVELEYFTHGDMCVAHGAQCYYSSMLFGMSSNRGKCLKPCRWWFDREGTRSYPLAVKDMSMIAHLPEMIHAGITSYKIEGRMREKEFIVDLINRYGEVFDRYIDDPVGYDYKEQEAWIFENRKRDLSTAYAFGNPGAFNINERYEGTGKFYSTGKMFSTPTVESDVDANHIEGIKAIFNEDNTKTTKVSVRVEDMEQAVVALEEDVFRIYLAADVFEPKRPFTIQEIQTLVEMKGKTELFVTTPQMMDAVQFDRYDAWLSKLQGIDGLLVTNLGAIEAFKKLGLKMVGDYSLNLFNKHAAAFYLSEGLSELTPSIELPAQSLKALLEENAPFEVITHGRMAGMYMSHDLYEVHQVSVEDQLIFENEAGPTLIKRDVHGKCHFLMQKTMTFLPFINQFNNANVRIEAQLMTADALRMAIQAHKYAIENKDATWDTLKAHLPEGSYTLGALRF